MAGGAVHGSLYMDFFGGATNQAMRLRTASIEIDWKTRSIMAGLEKPIFNPREPTSLAQVGISPLTGTGNLWLWLPQVRAEQDFAFGRSSGLRAQVGVLQTRERCLTRARPCPARWSRPVRRWRAASSSSTTSTTIGGWNSPPASTPARPTSAASRCRPACSPLDWFFNPWRPVEFSGAFYSGRKCGAARQRLRPGVLRVWPLTRQPSRASADGARSRSTPCRASTSTSSPASRTTRTAILNDGRIGKNLLLRRKRLLPHSAECSSSRSKARSCGPCILGRDSASTTTMIWRSLTAFSLLLALGVPAVSRATSPERSRSRTRMTRRVRKSKDYSGVVIWLLAGRPGRAARRRRGTSR